MKTYQFKESIVVDGTRYLAGDTATEDEIPPGNLASLIRLGQVSEVAPKSTDTPAAGPAVPPKPFAKKA